MGAIEEGSKLAGSFMDALRREPLSLALVAMNLALLGFFYFLMVTIATQREREVGLIYEDKKQTREILAHCVIPAPTPIPLPAPQEREKRGTP